VKHLGDITKINGATAPTVDCVIGGSPCQDLSIAGKRAGLAGERSGLYMEQIRLEVKAMNKALLSSKKMDWRTPQAFFDDLNREFHFVLDAAAMPENAKCTQYFTPETDGLSRSWDVGGSVFCNPPYGRKIGKWVQKAYSEYVRGGGDNRHADSRTDGHKLFPRLYLRKSGNSVSAWAVKI
jgi:hypothetical protein